jgi:hypothetical protein
VVGIRKGTVQALGAVGLGDQLGRVVVRWLLSAHGK